MFGAMTASGLVSGRGELRQRGLSTGSTVGLLVNAPDADAPDSIVTVHRDGGSTRAGLVLDGSGNVVVAAGPGDTLTDVRVDTTRQHRLAATPTATDEATGVVLLHVEGLRWAAPPQTAEATVGDRVRVGSASARVVTTGAARASEPGGPGCWVTISSPDRIGPSPAIDTAGRVVGLAVAIDDNPDDELTHLISAMAAMRVGRRLVDNDPMTTVDLGVALGDTAGVITDGATRSRHPIVVQASRASELAVGDEVVSVDSVEVHSVAAVTGLLIGRRAGEAVEIIVTRNGRRLTVSRDLTATQDSESVEIHGPS